MGNLIRELSVWLQWAGLVGLSIIFLANALGILDQTVAVNELAATGSSGMEGSRDDLVWEGVAVRGNTLPLPAVNPLLRRVGVIRVSHRRDNHCSRILEVPARIQRPADGQLYEESWNPGWPARRSWLEVNR